MSGCEWIIEAHGCDPDVLRDRARLAALFERLIRELDLHPVAPPVWHQFPAPGGLTGMALLAESHLTAHSFPEHASLCLNLFCCRPRPRWDFEGKLGEMLQATRVEVRHVARPYGGLA
jgi:S-adenosylmethionine decarboxylase